METLVSERDNLIKHDVPLELECLSCGYGKVRPEEATQRNLNS